MTTRVEYAENSVSDDELFGTYMVEFHEMTLTKKQDYVLGSSVGSCTETRSSLGIYKSVVLPELSNPKNIKVHFSSSLF